MMYCGAEQTVTVNGKRLRLSRFTRGLLKEWLAWATDQVPSALSVVQQALAYPLPPDLKERLLWETILLVERTGTMEDPAIQAVYQSHEGTIKILELILTKYHFENADKLAIEIFQHCDVERIIEKAQGKSPKNITKILERFMWKKGLAPEPIESDVPIDWLKLERDIYENLHKTTKELDDLTLSEIYMLHAERSGIPDTESIRYGLSQFPIEDQLAVAFELYG